VDRPPASELLEGLRRAAERAGLRAPSRATLYNLLPVLPTRRRLRGELPPAVREALYNFDDQSAVPEAQIAFYCFNYGDGRAFSWAAGLPWLALYQAARMRGWRPKSRGLLEAVLRARGI
jgi:hypothetical protein